MKNSSLLPKVPKQPVAQFNGLAPLAQPEAPKLSIQLVPGEIALAPDRFFLAVDYEGHRWVYPIQLSRGEIQNLIQQAQGLTLAEEGRR